MVDKTKRYKVNEQLKELTKSLDDISNRLTKLEIKESNKLDRAKVWVTVASRVASASDCKNQKTAVIWADYVLVKYDERFN